MRNICADAYEEQRLFNSWLASLLRGIVKLGPWLAEKCEAVFCFVFFPSGYSDIPDKLKNLNESEAGFRVNSVQRRRYFSSTVQRRSQTMSSAFIISSYIKILQENDGETLDGYRLTFLFSIRLMREENAVGSICHSTHIQQQHDSFLNAGGGGDFLSQCEG